VYFVGAGKAKIETCIFCTIAPPNTGYNNLSAIQLPVQETVKDAV
jgi:hypothetical protein